MQLVYLTPPPVVGMDGSSHIPPPANVHMYHPNQIAQQQMQPPHQPFDGSRGFASNMNNNNATAMATMELTQSSLDKRHEVNSSKINDEVNAEDATSVPSNNSSDASGNIKNVNQAKHSRANSTVAENSEADYTKKARNGGEMIILMDCGK